MFVNDIAIQQYNFKSNLILQVIESVPITINVVISNPAHGDVYSI
jgi:hypothetical protein